MNFKFLTLSLLFFIVNAEHLRKTKGSFDDDGVTFARERNTSSETEYFDVTIVEEDDALKHSHVSSFFES